MKICENCNLSFDDGKKFCFKCGSPLTTVDQMVAKAESSPPKSEKYKSGGWKYSSPIETNKPVFERIPKAESIDEQSEHQSSPSAALFAQAQIFLKNNQLENAIEKFRVLYEEGQQDKIVILYVGIGKALLSDYH
ncbi:MAG: zinc ribbon domain-containing protein, partial [Bacteroidales bacterium]|nr:zinc ribbon domain-containing protein [Bacteroidales bacterium]